MSDWRALIVLVINVSQHPDIGYVSVDVMRYRDRVIISTIPSQSPPNVVVAAQHALHPV